MINKILGVIFLLSFVLTSASEVQSDIVLTEVHKSSLSIDKSSSNQVISYLVESHCKDCKDDDCSDESHCCENFCACAPSIPIGTRGDVWFLSLPSFFKIDRVAIHQYSSPPLDPAARPPSIT